MRRGRLLHARDPLGTCLEQGCPPSLRSDCADWLKEVESRTPSVVIECVQDGASVREVKSLSIDGTVRPSGIDGLAIDLDPGNHSFRIEPKDVKDGPPIVIDTLIREGEKLKAIRFELPSRTGGTKTTTGPLASASTNAPPPEMHRPIPWTVYASAGVGVVALGGFTLFAISGAAGKSDLESCKPDCSESQLSDVRTRFIAADVFLGVAAVALGVATVLYLTRPQQASVATGANSSPRSAFQARF